MAYEFKSAFAEAFKQMVAGKKSLGFEYEDTQVKSFGRIDQFFFDKGIDGNTLTKEVCEEWCAIREGESARNHYNRVGRLRQVCSYLNLRGYQVYVPPKGIPKVVPQYQPHIYTDDELRRFFIAVDSLKPVKTLSPFRHITAPLYFRTLYTSGMRLTELRLVRVGDVDLKKAAILVRFAKNKKQRIVPVHPNLIPRCRTLMEKLHPKANREDYFFPIVEGKPWGRATVYGTFRRCLEKAGIPHGDKGPRVHDFRHTYCVNVLRKWLREGKDLMEWLPYLRTALGHETFTETAYYLKLTARAFPEVCEQVSKALPSLIKEIEDEGKEYY